MSAKLNSLDIDFTVFVLTETRFSADLVRNINEFVCHHSFPDARGGGCVSLYCANNLCFVLIIYNDNL